jgi:hypothetical protein
MEAIKTYLETILSALPNTEESFRLKNELLISMEEKYSELKAKGKSENEAIGTVISEFGNIEELAEEIGSAKTEAAEYEKIPEIDLTTVQNFLQQLKVTSSNTAIGVFMILLGVAVLLGFFVAGNLFISDIEVSGFELVLGVIFFVVLLAVAVGILSLSWLRMLKYEFISHKFTLSEHVRQYVQNIREKSLSKNITYIAIGVTAIVLSSVAVIIPAIAYRDANSIITGVAIFLGFVGVGTAPLIVAGLSIASFDTLLGRVGEGEWFSGVYVGPKGIHVGNEVHIDENGIRVGKDVYIAGNAMKSARIIGTVSAIFWPLVIAAYLLWSFLSGNWGFTWIIWPIAALAFGAFSGGVGAYYNIDGDKT